MGGEGPMKKRVFQFNETAKDSPEANGLKGKRRAARRVTF